MGRSKKYNTDEERKAASKESQKKWREEHPNYQTEWRQNNKEKIAEYQTEWRGKNPDYNTEYRQKNKEKIAAQKAEYRQNNREKIAKYNAEYYQSNKEKFAEYVVTPKGRAQMHVDNYTRIDKVYNRGECTLTADWIVEHIFNQPCHYCGRTDWHELGCDRINNALPHTPDNVVPCCTDCNKKKARYSYDEFMRMIGKIA